MVEVILTHLAENSEAYMGLLGAIGAVAASLWSVFEGSKFYEKHISGKKYAKALDALEMGAQQVYDEYVRELKRGSADGTLTLEEMKEARKRAFEHAKRYGQTHGVDVIKTLGGDYLDVLLEMAIKRLKDGTAGENKPE